MCGGSKSSLLILDSETANEGNRGEGGGIGNAIFETSWELGNNAFKLNELLFLYVHVIDSIAAAAAAAAAATIAGWYNSNREIGSHTKNVHMHTPYKRTAILLH